MLRVGFAGVPGAGKTSTARGVASTCRRIEGLKNVELSAEYARRYIAKYGKIESVWEQFRILKKQLDWEDTVGEVDLLVTDAPMFMGLMYAQMLNSGTPKDVMLLNDLFGEMNKLNNPEPRYDIIFHLPPKVQPVRDGVRPESNFDPVWRNNADAELRAAFRLFKPTTFHTVEAVDLDKRIEECLQVLQQVMSCKETVTIIKPREDYYCVIDGIIHACDKDGWSRCERGKAPIYNYLPESKGQQCPVCFGGGGA